jgi:molybdate/tungstate transport system substrate-binding protein
MESRVLTVYLAGSLRGVFSRLAGRFEATHRGLRVDLVAGGSVDLARRLENGERADLFASADYGVIREMSRAVAPTCVPFARNRMVLAFRPGAEAADAIGRENWYRLLLDRRLAFAYSDPNLDPGGYRTLLVWRLAERHYGEPGLFEALRAAPSGRIYSGERMLQFYQDFRAAVFDYAFAYASSVVQNGLSAVRLPVEIDLSDPNLAATYASGRVVTRGVGGEVERVGEPILYAATVPGSAREAGLGEEFLGLLLGPEGALALREAGMEPLAPA